MSSSTRTTWAWAVATFGGIGFLPLGPGTWASIATAALWWLAARQLDPVFLLLGTPVLGALVAVVGTSASTVVARESGKEDPSHVVIDEVAGQLLTFIAAPTAVNWKYVLAGLILFRALDIIKPPPVRQLEKLPGGLGIMMDDVAAGLIAAAVLLAIHHFAHWI